MYSQSENSSTLIIVLRIQEYLHSCHSLERNHALVLFAEESSCHLMHCYEHQKRDLFLHRCWNRYPVNDRDHLSENVASAIRVFQLASSNRPCQHLECLSHLLGQHQHLLFVNCRPRPAKINRDSILNMMPKIEKRGENTSKKIVFAYHSKEYP